MEVEIVELGTVLNPAAEQFRAPRLSRTVGSISLAEDNPPKDAL